MQVSTSFNQLSAKKSTSNVVRQISATDQQRTPNAKRRESSILRLAIAKRHTSQSTRVDMTSCVIRRIAS